MSFASLLINTGTFRRYTPGAIDSYGNPAEGWANLHVDQPCRLMAMSDARGANVKVGAEVVIAHYKLFLDDDLDVTEQDRVVIGGVTYEVLMVEHRQDSDNVHHQELLMNTVR